MNAIRPGERLDELHSVYVDQWDWELVISPADRTLRFLHSIVERIYGVIMSVELEVARRYPEIQPVLPDAIAFVHSEELQARWPDRGPSEREDRICAEHGAVFVTGIGAVLADGQPHDTRAPDYDDWSTPTERGTGLNGDILLSNPVLDGAFEISSMGIRVDAKSLTKQLALTSTQDRASLQFHRRLLAGDLPYSIGGGIGQSRLCMFLLRKAHIGEVQSSVWPADMRESLRKRNVHLL